jgi:hypothetical protein
VTERNLASHVWDHQFALAIHVNGGLSITPAKNLIHNIGSIGTHSYGQQKCHTLLASEEFKIEKEPAFVLANREYDFMHFKSHIYYPTSVISRAVKKMLRILGQ